MMKNFRRLFLEGLLFMLPLTLTVYLVFIIFRWLYEIFNFAVYFLPEPYKKWVYIKIAVTLVTVFILIILIVIIGAIVKTVLGRAIEKGFERILTMVPGANSFYRSVKQLFSLVFQNDPAKKYSKVVMVEFPSRGSWAIAFLTGKYEKRSKPDRKKEFYTVFMPTSPNPTTGFLLVLTKKQIHETDLTIDEAMKMILSGGIIKE